MVGIVDVLRMFIWVIIIVIMLTTVDGVDVSPIGIVIDVLYYAIPVVAWTFAKSANYTASSCRNAYVAKMVAYFLNVVQVVLVIIAFVAFFSSGVVIISLVLVLLWLVIDLWGLTTYRKLKVLREAEERGAQH